MATNREGERVDDSLRDALDEFYDLWLGGQPPEVDEFCESHAELAPELRFEIDKFLFTAVGIPPPSGAECSATTLPAGNEEEGAPELAGYRIIRQIGRGGMGVVFEAEQILLRRRVALKILSSHLLFSPDAIRKFQREAEAGARQHHPGIVTVYDVGEEDGVSYIAQELVEEGRTLADRMERRLVDGDPDDQYLDQVVEIIAEVADALHHAHETGVIHRDIKPSNILLTTEGHPKITDFGLARVEDALALSRTGEFAGTPFYMSPEQVNGDRGEIDHRTDVYSLGVTLYEAITLQRPFQSDSTIDLLKKIVDTDPIDPRSVNGRVQRDLAAICLKAMEKEPSHRYATMADFAEDLRRNRRAEPVEARPVTAIGRALRKARRNRKLVLSGAAGILLFVLAIWYVAQRPADIAGPRIWRVPEDHSTIQDALAAARYDDTILVAPGVYQENVDFLGKFVHLKSREGPEVTIIDGNDEGRVITFGRLEGPDSIVEGFTLRNGRAHDGAGVLCSASSPTILRCVIKDNVAENNGGGIGCEDGASPMIRDCHFTGNQAEEDGGALASAGSTPTIVCSRLSDNRAMVGAAVSSRGSDVKLLGCLLVDNWAIKYGGAAFVADGGHCTISFATIYGNLAGASGGGLRSANGRATIDNTILWMNLAPKGTQLDVKTEADVGVTFCDIENGWPGQGNLDADPLLVDPDSGDYHLTDSSPCRKAGSSIPVEGLEIDADGHPRWRLLPDGGREVPDIGFDEYVASQDTARESVGQAASFASPLSPSEREAPQVLRVLASKSIQEVIDSARDGDVILVSAGTYLEIIDFRGKAITVKSESGPAETVLDGNGVGSVVTFQSGETRSSVLEGFTITGGEATFGAGIRCVRSSSPTIRNNEIRENRAILSGGGIALIRSHPLIEGNRILENEARMRGGGICCGEESDPVISTNTIRGNTALHVGGAVCWSDSLGRFVENDVRANRALVGGAIYCAEEAMPELRGNFISSNTASHSYGGAIFIGGASPRIIDNWVVGNKATTYGGGIHIAWDSPVELDGNVIAGNQAPRGGGICLREAWPILHNVIVWGNEAGNGVQLHIEHDAAFEIYDSVIAGGHPGEGVIDADPLLEGDEPGEGRCEYPYRPTAGSPCIDAGGTIGPGQLDRDLEGNLRIVDGDGDGRAEVDIGAVEFMERD